MKDAINSALNLANRIKKDAEKSILPPSEITNLYGSQFLPLTLFKQTRGYLEKVTIQINQSYENTCYDACAVMVRRLTEILLIETFEAHGKAGLIKDSNGDYCMLNDLITKFLSESWTPNPSRNLKKSLPELKGIGDKSAHSRFYNAQRSDIDNIKVQLRGVTEELLYLSKIKK